MIRTLMFAGGTLLALSACVPAPRPMAPLVNEPPMIVPPPQPLPQVMAPPPAPAYYPVQRQVRHRRYRYHPTTVHRYGAITVHRRGSREAIYRNGQLQTVITRGPVAPGHPRVLRHRHPPHSAPAAVAPAPPRPTAQ